MTPELAVLDALAADLRSKSSATQWPRWMDDARRNAHASAIEETALALRQALAKPAPKPKRKSLF